MFDSRKWQLIRQSLWELGKNLRYRLILHVFCSLLPADYLRISKARDILFAEVLKHLSSMCLSYCFLNQFALLTFGILLSEFHSVYFLVKMHFFFVSACSVMMSFDVLSSYTIRPKECFLLLYPVGLEVPGKFSSTGVIYFWTII